MIIVFSAAFFIFNYAYFTIFFLNYEVELIFKYSEDNGNLCQAMSVFLLEVVLTLVWSPA